MLVDLLKLQHSEYSDLAMHHFPNHYSAMMTIFNRATIHALSMTLAKEYEPNFTPNSPEKNHGPMPSDPVRDHHRQADDA